MERLLANLFENAAKYTPAVAGLFITAAVEDHDGERVVRVCVDDDGPGLPLGIQPTLFDKFTRGEKESAKPGIGLGLAICRAIVEAHGGKIGAENRQGADGNVLGARFWFTLPASGTPPFEALPDESSAEPPDVASNADRP